MCSGQWTHADEDWYTKRRDMLRLGEYHNKKTVQAQEAWRTDLKKAKETKKMLANLEKLCDGFINGEVL